METDGSEVHATTVAAEVERLRQLAPDTKALYREVAAAMFFRFGVTPTANRLYQLVGKGSMSTAATVLARFWQDLRDHSRLQLNHPGIPEPLRDVAGELIGQVWKAAYAMSQQDFERARDELQFKTDELQRLAASAQQTAEEQGTLARDLAEQLAAFRSAATERERLISAGEERSRQLQSEIDALTTSLSERRSEVVAAKDAFGKQLESLRSAIALTEERARASERRALSDVEAARLGALQAKKTLATERKRAEAERARLQKALARRESELESSKERVAKAESALANSKAQLKRAEAQFSRLLARVQPAGTAKRRPA